MIKVSKKPKRYSALTKVSSEAMTDSIFMKFAIRDNRLINTPKNSLKIVRVKTFIGLDSDDFVRNLTTIKTDYLVYTFKR